MSVEESESQKTILVAQREAPDQAFITHLLSKVGGFRVVEAGSAREVILRLQDSPDLILVDLHVPGDFVKALELMRRMPKLNHVGIAALSGDLSIADLYARKGLNGFIGKPFTAEGLLARVWKVLDDAPPLPGDGSPAELNVDVDKIEGLPTLPTVYAQVETLCEDPDVDAEELAKVIESDPSITMKLLKLANSAFFGFRREVQTVRDAVSLLGNQTVKNAVLSISVFEAMKGADGSAGLDRTAFWRHATAVGSVARFLTKKMKIEREEAFTAGILHDIGKIVLDSLFPDFYRPVLERVASDNLTILEAETSGSGVTHPHLGLELAESWEIPKALGEAIAYHHRPSRSDLDPELASLIHIGDAVARNLGAGSGGDPLVPVIDISALTKLGVTPDDLVSWEEEVAQEVDKDMSFLSAIQ